jgi:hypothetical protein
MKLLNKARNCGAYETATPVYSLHWVQNCTVIVDYFCPSWGFLNVDQFASNWKNCVIINTAKNQIWLFFVFVRAFAIQVCFHVGLARNTQGQRRKINCQAGSAQVHLIADWKRRHQSIARSRFPVSVQYTSAYKLQPLLYYWYWFTRGFSPFSFLCALVFD